VHTTSHHTDAKNLKDKVLQATGINITECYQCGKCTAGCPLNQEMDYQPNQVLRMLQADLPGYEDKILGSMSIWMCLACNQCYSRCPQSIALANIMDFLRQESLRQGKMNPKARDILSFHQSFLDSIEKNGRLHEMGLVIDYKLKSMNLMQDATLAPTMMAKGKLHLFPHKIKNIQDIKKIFTKTKNK